MNWYMYLAVVGTGVVAGFINTLAGGGSALTLPILIFLGLPANVANGTNRIAILLQSLVAVGEFKKQKALNLKEGLKLALPSILGAIPGAFFALSLNEYIMHRVVGSVLVIMLMLIIIKPEIWIKSKKEPIARQPKWVSFIVFFLIGAFGGFIQVGVGFFLLAGLVLVEKTGLVKANAVKVFLVLMYTPFALAIFMLNKQVDYKLSLVLAAGSMAGAWVGTKLAVSWGASFIRWVLVFALVASSAKLFGLF